MARPRKPTSLKLLQGTLQKCRTNADEPFFESEIPDPPDHLLPAALEEWHRKAPMLGSMGLISEASRSALAAYCVAYARWAEAERLVSEHGFMLKAPTGFPIQSPYLAVANKAMEQMLKCMSAFGMTPESQSKVSGKKKEPEKKKRLDFL